MKRVLCAGAAAAVLALGGCRPAQEAGVRQQVQGVRQQISDAADNAALSAKVKAALIAHKGLDAGDIHVEARGNTVTLKGDVKSPEQASLAENVAMDTKGVEHVKDELTMRIPAKSGAGQ